MNEQPSPPGRLRLRATYQDVIAAPPHMVAEIAHGALHLHPRPASRHARAATMLGVEIGGAFDRGRDGPGGWWIIAEPELHLGDDVLVPDLAGWRRSSMPVFPDAPWFDLAPDWVCEVVSPSTRRFDLGSKRALYAEHGVAHLWLVDPLARTLEAFTLFPLRILTDTLAGTGPVRLAPFEAIEFPLEALWPD